MDLAMTLVERIEEQEAVGDDGYRRIRTDIVFGRLRPGQKLRLDGLKEDYGVSVSTLREILNRLAAEGFVLAEGRRGFEVAPVSAENFKELANLRLLLEGHALQRSFQLGDMDWEGRVVAAHHKLATMERRMAANEPSPAETWRQYDWAFHVALISACGSDLLLETYESICDKYLRYQMIAATFRGQIAADEHRMLLEYALERDWQEQATVRQNDEVLDELAEEERQQAVAIHTALQRMEDGTYGICEVSEVVTVHWYATAGSFNQCMKIRGTSGLDAKKLTQAPTAAFGLLQGKTCGGVFT